MGGRGSGSFTRIKMTLAEFLGVRGLSAPMSGFMIDKMRSMRMTDRQRKSFEKEANQAADDYQERRATAITEYRSLVEQGKILTPTPLEQMVTMASGHPGSSYSCFDG